MSMKILAQLSAALIVTASTAVIAAPVTYTIDGSHTFVRFSYNHLGLSAQSSQFNGTTGTVVWDQEAGMAEVELVIDTTSVETGFPLFNEHIQGEDFFNTAEYPTATFTSTQVVFDGERPVSIDGELTIKGITQPVTLEVTHFAAMPHPMLQSDAIGANATTVVNRSDFDAGKYAPHVGDEVTISISLEAIVQD